MKLSRLRGRKVNDFLRRKGHVWKGKTMTVRWLPEAPRNPNINPQTPAIYVGLSASTKLDASAVKRNRMRRRVREALRVTVREKEKLPVLQLLISPKRATLTCDFSDIQADVAAFLSSVT